MKLEDAEVRARDLIGYLLDPAWSFRWDNARRRFGMCEHLSQTISLSRHLVALNDEDEVLEVVLHEIAHAIAGVDAGHRSRWKQIAESLGAQPERCYDTASVRHPTGYVGRCPSCAATISRARRYLVACKACCDRFNGGKFSATYRIVWGDAPGRDPWISAAFGGS